MELQGSTAIPPRALDGADLVVPAISLPAGPGGPTDRGGAPLGPAATLDLSVGAKSEAKSGAKSGDEAGPAATTDKRRFSVDEDTHQVVFQVYDPASGAIIDQLPDEHALRARAYVRERQGAQTAQARTSLDRSA